MFDFLTVALLIALSAGVSVAVFYYFTKSAGNSGGAQLMGSFLAYGLSFLCMSFMGTPRQFYWLMVATIFYSYAVCFTLWSIRKFFNERVNAFGLLLIPLAIGCLYFLLLNNGPLRTRLIAGFFLFQYVLIFMDLLILPKNNKLHGRRIISLAIILLAISMIIRLFQPNLSLAARPFEGGAYALLASYAVLLIALQLTMVGYIFMVYDRSEGELRSMVVQDALTGVASRRELMSKLEEKIENARRLNESVGVFMLDVDHFKRVNDLCGHVEGDKVLSSIGGC